MAVPSVSTPPSGLGAGRTFKTGWYYAPDNSGADNVQTIPTGFAFADSFSVGEDRTFDRIGLEVTTGQSGALVRLGIYLDSGGAPAALVLDAGTIDASSTGAKEIVISQFLPSGRYWVAAQATVAAPTIRGRTGTPNGRLGWSSIANENGTGMFIANSGALPSPFGSPTVDQVRAILKIQLRAA